MYHNGPRYHFRDLNLFSSFRLSDAMCITHKVTFPYYDGAWRICPLLPMMWSPSRETFHGIHELKDQTVKRITKKTVTKTTPHTMHSNHFRNMLDWSMESSSILSWENPEGGAVGGSAPPNGNVRHGGVGIGSSGVGGAPDSLCSSYYDMTSSLATSMNGSMMSSMASACLTPCTPVSFNHCAVSRIYIIDPKTLLS